MFSKEVCNKVKSAIEKIREYRRANIGTDFKNQDTSSKSIQLKMIDYLAQKKSVSSPYSNNGVFYYRESANIYYVGARFGEYSKDEVIEIDADYARKLVNTGRVKWVQEWV